MQSQQLSRLTWQAYSIILRRQQHMPSLLPVMLRSCIFHLSRINSALITSHPCPQLLSQSVATIRDFSTSVSVWAVKKSANKKASVGSGSETCQVFNQSEMLVGHMTINEAEELARRDNLKLLDMGVNSDGLHSFRLISGQELAEESKRQRMDKKNEKVKEKEFRVTSSITDHDLEIKLRQAKDVLTRGAQVKFVIRAHRRAAQGDGDKMISQLMKKVTRELEDLAVIQQGVRTRNEQQLLLRPLPLVQPSGSK